MTKKYQVTCECGFRVSVAEEDLGQVGKCPRCYGPLPFAPWLPSTVVPTPATPIETQPSESAEWNPGDVVLDLFEIKSLLGQGGMGKVYRVFHRAWQTDLAVKCPKPEALARAGGFETFERECETWVNLGLHPHVVSCYYVRRIGGIPRIFAEFMGGKSLWHWIQKGLLHNAGPKKAIERTLILGVQTAWGLHHAHEMGLVHLDVKTPNVMMTPKGTAKVTDFGLARALSAGGTAAARAEVSSAKSPAISSITGMTPAYCSPEQYRGEPLTRATDIWSWGLCILEMLVGRIFWRVGTEAPKALRQLMGEVTTAARVPRVPASLANLLERCFDADPAARPATVLEAAEALGEVYREVTGERFPFEPPKPIEGRAESLNNRAVSLLDLGKEPEALQCWSQALQCVPHHPESTFNRNLLEWREGRITDEVFLQRLHEVASLHPDNPLVTHLLFQAHTERGDWRKAISLMKKSDNTATCSQDVAELLKFTQDLYRGSRRRLRRCRGHVDAVTCVRFLPGGGQGISASEDNTLRLWDVAAGECLRVFEGHSGSVQSVAVTQDGQFVASAGNDQTVRLWRVDTGECVRVFEGHSAAISALAFSPDGAHLVSGAADKTLILWRTDTGYALRTLKGHQETVTSAAFGGSQKSVVSASLDGTVRVWDLATGRFESLLRPHEGGVHSVRYCGDGDALLTCGNDARIRMWNLKTSECTRTFEGHRGPVLSAEMSPDGRYIVSGSSDGTVRIWHSATARCLRTFSEPDRAVRSVSISVDGALALSGAQDGSVKVWCLGTAATAYAAPLMLCQAVETEKVLTADTSFKRALEEASDAIDRSPVEAAQCVRRARGLPGYLRRPEAMELWFRLYTKLPKKRLENAWEGLTLSKHEGGVRGIRISASGRRLLSIGADDTLRIWDSVSGQCSGTLHAENTAMNALALAETANMALTSASDGALTVWDFRQTTPRYVFESFGGTVESVHITPDGRFIVSAGWEINLRDGSTGRLLRSFEHDPPGAVSICLSRDAQLLLTGGTDGALDLWEVASGECIRTFRGQRGTVWTVALSTDGRFALTASGTPWGSVSELCIWNIASGECIRNFDEHVSPISCAVLSEDNRLAVSGHRDGSIVLWDLLTGSAMRNLRGHKDAVTAVAIARNARFAASASADGTIKTWLLDWELEDYPPGPWTKRALPYLNSFAVQHAPWAFSLPEGRLPDPEEIAQALVRETRATWTKEDFADLLYLLGCAGYGWIERKEVLDQLERVARHAGEISFVPPPLG